MQHFYLFLAELVLQPHVGQVPGVVHLRPLGGELVPVLGGADHRCSEVEPLGVKIVFGIVPAHLHLYGLDLSVRSEHVFLAFVGLHLVGFSHGLCLLPDSQLLRDRVNTEEVEYVVVMQMFWPLGFWPLA